MKILIVEDDEKLSKIMQKTLLRDGIDSDICGNGRDVEFYIQNTIYDVIIMDRMLPGLDGLSALRRLRKDGCLTPVIMVTAMGETRDRIDGLDGGADDYLVKPFDVEELSARIRALLRRPQAINEAGRLSFGDLTLCPNEHLLAAGEASCELSKKEMDLIECLIRNKGQTLTRDVLLSRVWGLEADVTDGNLDNYISFLRKRLRSLDSRVTIKTIHSVGYRIEDHA